MTIARIGLLLLRRFIAPVVVSALALTGVALLLALIGAGPRFLEVSLDRVQNFASGMTWVFLVFTAPAILVIGLPAGYVVARLRLGLLRSLLLLVAIGFVCGVLIMMAIFGVPSDELNTAISGLLLLGALPGSITALVWGLFNLDLYQRQVVGHRR